MPLNKVQVPRISDAVAASLERRILEGSLKSGDRLPPERELATDFGVSRPSLREAIQKLALKGMVQSRQGGGTYVTNALEATFFDPWQDMMGSHPNLREDMLEFRRMIEGQAAEWAAERATEADLTRLGQCFATLNASFSHENMDQRSDADIAFHQAVGEAAHNALLGHLSSALLRLMHDNIRLNLGELKSVPAAGACSRTSMPPSTTRLSAASRKPPVLPPKHISILSAKPWPKPCAASPVARLPPVVSVPIFPNPLPDFQFDL